MKSQNAPTVRLSQRVGFVYEAENASLVRRLNNIVENAQNNEFVMHVTFEKKSVNVLQKSTVLGVKRSLFKNPVWSVKKIHPGVYQKVSYK